MGARPAPESRSNRRTQPLPRRGGFPNNGQFTPFAPVDDAFAKLPSATIDSLETDSAGLTNILIYHAVPGRVNPQNVDGVHKTLQGGADLTVTGFGNILRVNNASVVCAGGQTANATAYLIDTVLTPPAM